MAQFIMLLPHSPDRYADTSEAEFMELMKDYIGWVQEMSEKGIYAGGEKLQDEGGKVLTRDGNSVDVHEGPFTELAEVIGGYMIINADNYDAAVEIAKTCPHLKHNSKIILRQTSPTD